MSSHSLCGKYPLLGLLICNMGIGDCLSATAEQKNYVRLYENADKQGLITGLSLVKKSVSSQHSELVNKKENKKLITGLSLVKWQKEQEKTVVNLAKAVPMPEVLNSVPSKQVLANGDALAAKDTSTEKVARFDKTLASSVTEPVTQAIKVIAGQKVKETALQGGDVIPPNKAAQNITGNVTAIVNNEAKGAQLAPRVLNNEAELSRPNKTRSVAISDQAEDVFDIGGLLTNGLSDAEIAKIINDEVLDGTYPTVLNINGDTINLEDVTFTNQQPCLRSSSVIFAKVAVENMTFDSQGCLLFDHAQFDYDITSQTLSLYIPDGLLRQQVNRYESGGSALVTNYNLFYRGSGDNAITAQFQNKLFLSNWILENSGSWQNSQFSSGRTFLHRDFVDYSVTFEAGELSGGNNFLSTPLFKGVAIASNNTQLAVNRQGSVTGTVDQPSEITLKQRNQVIYTTVVGTGQYNLTNFTLNSINDDIEVEERDLDGNLINTSTRPAQVSSNNSLFSMPQNQEFNYYFGIGQSDNDDNFVTTASVNFGQLPEYSLANVQLAGLVLNDELLVTAGAASMTFNDNLRLGVNMRHSLWLRNEDNLPNGNNWSVNLSGSFIDGLATTLNYQSYSQHFRLSLPSEGSVDESDVSNRIIKSSIGLGLGGNLLNTNFGLIGYRRTYYDKNVEDYMSFNLSRRIGKGNLNLNFQKNLTSDEVSGIVTFNLPFGGQENRHTTNSNMVYRNERATMRTSVQSSYGDLSYSANLNHDLDRSATGAGISLRYSAPYADFATNYNKNDYNSSHYSGISGALALHKDGVSLSNKRIADTLLVTQVKDWNTKESISSVKVGKSKNYAIFGGAISSDISPYRSSVVGIDNQSIPDDISIVIGQSEIKARSGAVVHNTLYVKQVVKFLLTIVGNTEDFEQGVIFSKEGDMIGVIDRFGQTYLEVEGASLPPLEVELVSGKMCQLRLQEDSLVKDDMFTRAKATCE